VRSSCLDRREHDGLSATGACGRAVMPVIRVNLAQGEPFRQARETCRKLCLLRKSAPLQARIAAGDLNSLRSAARLATALWSVASGRSARATK